MQNGIYTLANDRVYDQLVALLNSIEQNAGNLPVCVIAYNDQIERIRAEIENRDHVFLLDNPTLFERWESFSYQVWNTHPTALADWKAQGVTTSFYRVGENHRYVAFDDAAPFEQFIYLDADTLVLQPLDFVFDRLNQADVVTYDFQFKDLSHIFNTNSARLHELFDAGRLATEIFCSGFYASKRGLFPTHQLDWLLSQLKNGDSEVLYPRAPNQSLLNYMIMRTGLKVHNVALEWKPEGKATGNSVTSKHFEAQNHVLYDKGNRLTYLHYIGVSSKYFQRLCAGENLEIPYRDIFLHYRYLSAPEERPTYVGSPKPPVPLLTFKQKLFRKIGLPIG